MNQPARIWRCWLSGLGQIYDEVYVYSEEEMQMFKDLGYYCVVIQEDDDERYIVPRPTRITFEDGEG